MLAPPRVSDGECVLRGRSCGGPRRGHRERPSEGQEPRGHHPGRRNKSSTRVPAGHWGPGPARPLLHTSSRGSRSPKAISGSLCLTVAPELTQQAEGPGSSLSEGLRSLDVPRKCGSRSVLAQVVEASAARGLSGCSSLSTEAAAAPAPSQSPSKWARPGESWTGCPSLSAHGSVRMRWETQAPRGQVVGLGLCSRGRASAHTARAAEGAVRWPTAHTGNQEQGRR